MTPEQLAAIKARAGALTPFVDAVENHPMQLTDTRPEVVDLLVVMTKTAQDVPVLLAEVERLGRLYHSVADEAARYDAAAIAAEVEVARLRAQVERWEKDFPCEQGCSALGYPDEVCSAHGRPPSDLWQRWEAEHKRAERAEAQVAAVEALCAGCAAEVRAAIAEAGGAS